jgi:diguanylate cyclase (GGDEF)-like protein/PAS domain S-box-containing protein
MMFMTSDTSSSHDRNKNTLSFWSEERSQLRCKQVELLYDQLRVGQAGSIAAALSLVGVFWTITPHSILMIWFSFLLVVGAFRLNLIHRYERSSGGHEQAEFWLGWFIAGTVASGITWGLATIILVPDRSIAHISFVLLWTGGLSAGTVAAYSVIKGAFIAFSLPALILPALYLLFLGGKVEATIGAGTIMFFVFLSLNALRMHRTLMRELELRFENTQLIGHLENEKERVDRINDQLEKRVAERTAALCESNAYLQKEIAGRKRTEEALSQAAAVFENTTEGAMITDTEDRIVAVNKAFTEITGYDQTDVVGKTPRVLHSGKHDESFYTAISASITQTGRWRGEVWNRRKNGEIFPVWLNISNVVDDRGQVTHYVSVFSDITPIKESQAQLERLAHHDALTGLPNRLLFHARLEHALERTRREGGLLAILCFDLDHFKNINDSLGHPAGDRLLQAVTKRLLDSVRREDTVARLSGDEFTVLLEELRESKDAGIVAEKALNVLAEPFNLDGHKAYVTASVGISLFPDDGRDVTTLLKNADSALYRAKEHGRNNYHFYTKDLTVAAFKRLTLESNLRRAVERGEFRLYYQPQVALNDGHVVGAEALVRWQHPKLGLVLPTEFIPMTESTGLVVKLGEWVMRTACAQARAWQKEGLPPMRIAVNVSSVQVTRGGIITTVERVLQETGLDPQYMELEITEGLIMQQTHQTLTTLDELKAMGVRLAIDDFGTGYSSLSYLKRLPLHRLKIDKSFVCEIPDDSEDMAITRAVIALGNSLQLVVIAEGVENKIQLEFLRSNGCDEAQGYLYGAPVPAADFVALVRNEGGEH